MTPIRPAGRSSTRPASRHPRAATSATGSSAGSPGTTPTWNRRRWRRRRRA